MTNNLYEIAETLQRNIAHDIPLFTKDVLACAFQHIAMYQTVATSHKENYRELFTRLRNDLVESLSDEELLNIWRSTTVSFERPEYIQEDVWNDMVNVAEVFDVELSSARKMCSVSAISGLANVLKRVEEVGQDE